MILQLSENVFTSSGHIVKGQPKEPDVYGEIPEGKALDTNADLTKSFFSEFSKPQRRDHCGWKSVAEDEFMLFGEKVTFYCCSAVYYDFFSGRRHGDAYEELAKAILDAKGHKEYKLEINTTRSYQGTVDTNPCQFAEKVCQWPSGNCLTNIIDTPTFIELCASGKIPNSGIYARHACGLLACIGRSNGSDPVKKLGSIINDNEALTEMLRSMSHYEGMNNHYRCEHPYFVRTLNYFSHGAN